MKRTVGKNYICILFIALLFSLFLTQNGLTQEKPLQKVSLSIQWLTQCQFAGYYAALEKGFYRQEGIDLKIIPGASDINPIHLVSAETADFGTKWLADFLAAKDKNIPLISIAQIVQNNGLIIIAKTKSGIKKPQDFIGKKLGIWFFGNETQFFALTNKLNISLNNISINELKWSIKPFLTDDYDAITAMRYNEYLRVIDNGYKENEINIINFSDYDLNFPGQVIFTRTAILREQPDLCERMVRASLRGWAWAIGHPKEAVEIVLEYDETKTLKRDHQLKQMKEIIKLVEYGNIPLGYHQPEQVEFVKKSLLQNNLVSHTLDLSEAYTNQVWEKVQLHHAK